MPVVSMAHRCLRVRFIPIEESASPWDPDRARLGLRDNGSAGPVGSRVLTPPLSRSSFPWGMLRVRLVSGCDNTRVFSPSREAAAPAWGMQSGPLSNFALLELAPVSVSYSDVPCSRTRFLPASTRSLHKNDSACVALGLCTSHASEVQIKRRSISPKT